MPPPGVAFCLAISSSIEMGRYWGAHQLIVSVALPASQYTGSRSPATTPF